MMIPDDSNQCAILKSLADPTRLRLIRLLFNEELNVQELVFILGEPQPKISRNLAILKTEQLVSDRRDGTKAYYRLSPLNKALDHFNELIKNIGNTDHPDLELLDICLKNRITSKELSVVENWEENLAQLYNPLTALPALAALAPRGLTVIDFGTGTGKMLPVLSQFSEKVYAVDHSQTMLNFAQKRCQRLGISNVEFIQADLMDKNLDLPQCDGVMMHFVIHQMPRPSLAIEQAKNFIKPGGRLVVIDRLKHSDEEARKTFGSLWLGFEESQLKEWFTKSEMKNFSWDINPDLNTPVPVFTASGSIIN